jgi:hypothetical protein
MAHDDVGPRVVASGRWRRLSAGAASLGIATSLVGSSARAQSGAIVAAGASFPTGSFGKTVNPGVMLNVGAIGRVGRGGLGLGVEGLYGSNAHSDDTRDRTNLTSVLGTIAYRAGKPTKPGLFVFGNVGVLTRSVQRANTVVSAPSTSALAYGGGVGAQWPIKRLSVLLSARYLTSQSHGVTTSFVAAQLGLTLPLGGGGRGGRGGGRGGRGGRRPGGRGPGR